MRELIAGVLVLLFLSGCLQASNNAVDVERLYACETAFDCRIVQMIPKGVDPALVFASIDCINAQYDPPNMDLLQSTFDAAQCSCMENTCGWTPNARQ